MTRQRDRYTCHAPCDRTVARMTIYFDTPPSPNDDARASRGREHPGSSATYEGSNVFLAPRAAPTIVDAPPAVPEQSRRPGRLRALRNYLAHRIIRFPSRHNEAQDHVATNATNIPEPTQDHSHDNESTRTSISLSTLTHEPDAETNLSHRLQGLEEHLFRLATRLDEVERRTHDVPPALSQESASDEHDLPERLAAGGRKDAHPSLRPGHVSSACSLPRPPSLHFPANAPLTSDGRMGTHAIPLYTGAPPPRRSQHGLPRHRRDTTRAAAAARRNGPPVTPISVNFSGQSIATSSPETLEAWNGTPPEPHHCVHYAVPLPSVPPLPQAYSGPFTDGPYTSLPPDGVWNDANAASPQPHESSDWSPPPPPLQLPIPLPDVDDPEMNPTPRHLPAYLPMIQGHPSTLGLDVSFHLPSPIQPHPIYKENHRFHRFWEEWNLATFLDAERIQALPPKRLSRRSDPQMVQYHQAVSAMLARKRTDARLPKMLFGDNSSSGLSASKKQRADGHFTNGLGSPSLPAEALRQRAADGPPKLALAQINAPPVGLSLPSMVEDNNPLANPTIAHDSSTERPTVAADVGLPPVPISVPAAVVPSIRAHDTAAVPATRGSTTSDKVKYNIPTYVGGFKQPEPVRGCV